MKEVEVKKKPRLSLNYVCHIEDVVAAAAAAVNLSEKLSPTTDVFFLLHVFT